MVYNALTVLIKINNKILLGLEFPSKFTSLHHAKRSLLRLGDLLLLHARQVVPVKILVQFETCAKLVVAAA